MSPAETLRAAAVRVRAEPSGLVHLDVADPLAYWLDGAALDAEEIGPDHRAVTFAQTLLRIAPDSRYGPDTDQT